LPTSASDRVAVADNLFAAGEIVTAAHVYSQVPVNELSRSEAGWVQYQIASCHRRLGQLDEARKGYRRRVTDPSLGWIQDLSKWWLGMIDEREALSKEHARLRALVQQAEKVTNVPQPR